jgi:lipoprotein-anchoring transpeptidase ErfK/SrfK
VGLPYPWIQQANPGVTELSIGQNITIPSPDDLLPFPVVPHKRIIVSISQQTTQVFENGELKWEWLTSTGIAASPTAPGIFQVQTHVDNAYAANWNLWMPNFMGIYRPVPTSDFMNGFHGFPTRDGSNLLWTNNLGGPVTYGCILLSNENAQALYNWAEEGVVVEIRP